MTYALPILLNLMRFAWLWPWMLLLQRFTSPSFAEPVVPPWLLVGVPLASFLLATWVTQRAPIPSAESTATTDPDSPQSEAVGWSARLLVAGAGLLVTLLVAWWHYYQPTHALWAWSWLYELGYVLTHWGMQEIPPQVLTVLLLTSLWINGMGDTVRAMTHDDVWAALVRSVGALVLFVIIMSVANQPLPPQLFYLIVLLFGAGMLALALSSLKITVGLDRALGLGQRRIAATPVVSRYWLGSVLLTVFGLLAVGLLIAILLAPEQLALLLDAAATLLRWVGWLLGQVLLVISYVLFLVIYFFARLLEPLMERLLDRMAESPLAEMLNQMEQTEQMEQVAEGTAALPDSYRWLGLAVVVAVILLAFALAVRRLRTTATATEDEIRESILTVDLLQEQLGDLWNRWFKRGRSPRDPFLSLVGESAARQQIRALYQQLLAGAAALGGARTPAETPVEYQQQLPRTWDEPLTPDEAAALATLTAAYHQARYAPDAPDSEQVAGARAAWEQLRRRLQPPTATDDDEAPATEAVEKQTRTTKGQG